MITAPEIAKMEEQKVYDSLREVLDGDFEPISELPSGTPSSVTAMYKVTEGGTEKGKVVTLSVKGYAGEILLTSMDADGTKAGFDLELTKAVTDAVSIPVIASGGCGALSHFKDVFTEANADAALAASLFHYKELTVGEVKDYLHENGIPVRRNIKL